MPTSSVDFTSTDPEKHTGDIHMRMLTFTQGLKSLDRAKDLADKVTNARGPYLRASRGSILAHSK